MGGAGWVRGAGEGAGGARRKLRLGGLISFSRDFGWISRNVMCRCARPGREKKRRSERNHLTANDSEYYFPSLAPSLLAPCEGEGGGALEQRGGGGGYICLSTGNVLGWGGGRMYVVDLYAEARRAGQREKGALGGRRGTRGRARSVRARRWVGM